MLKLYMGQKGLGLRVIELVCFLLCFLSVCMLPAVHDSLGDSMQRARALLEALAPR